MAAYDVAASSGEHAAVDIPAAVPLKPVAPPPSWWANPRNKWLAGGALLALIAIPAIVVPVVLTQNNNSDDSSTAQPASLQDSATALPASQADGNGVAGADDGAAISVADDFMGSEDVNATSALTNPLLANLTGGATNLTANVTKKAGKSNATWETEVVSPFVQISNGVFDLECRPFYPTGFNAFELTTLAATNAKDAVDDAFAEARKRGMNTARTWAHSITELYPFQTSPGKYDESGLKALDYVLDSASRHNITLILSLIDNWKYYNGVDQFVDWSTTAPGRSMQRTQDANGDADTTKMSDAQMRYEAERHSLFFSDADSRQMYKDHVDFITSRVNSYNGRVYKDDPTILSWNLINEPRCEEWAVPGCTDTLDKWYTEMAAYAKAAAPKQLISSGSEGFFAGSNPLNPADWAGQTGQDFSRNNAMMDFAVTHAWPDNWLIPNDQQGQFLGQWLRGHLDAAKAIGKPLLFEEFGKKLDDGDNAGAVSSLRDPVFRAAYQAIEQSIQNPGAPLLGSLYWKWAFPQFSKGPYGVEPEDSTMDIIEDHAVKMRALVNQMPPRPGCVMPISGGKATRPLGAWFPSPSKRVCANVPEASLAWYTIYGPSSDPSVDPDTYSFSGAAVQLADAISTGRVQVFATEAACCAPGTGGLGAQGCVRTGAAAAAVQGA